MMRGVGSLEFLQDFLHQALGRVRIGPGFHELAKGADTQRLVHTMGEL
jgi:hypothetical protein